MFYVMVASDNNAGEPLIHQLPYAHVSAPPPSMSFFALVLPVSRCFTCCVALLKC